MHESKKHILVGSAWPYANGPLHLGHIAALVGADVLARYHRLRGDAVLFISGSDCYGTPIAIEALKQNTKPETIANKYHHDFLETFRDKLLFSFDVYSSTLDPLHHKLVQDIFLNLHKKGYIYPKITDALYSPLLNQFLPDRFVEGDCPHCGESGARGDQCDACGSLIDALTLKNPRINKAILPNDVDTSKTDLEIRPSEHFFLNLQKCEEQLQEFVDTRGESWRINALQITRAFLKQGLRDRAITRDTSWGIPVPLKGYEDKRIYVWFEAVLGYLSASKKAPLLQKGPYSWEEWWESDNALHYYVHGKDNVPFHSIILPAILLGNGNLHLPDREIASEHLSLEGKKFSTSNAWAVLVPDFLETFDAEMLRYYLISQGPETSDTNFTWDAFKKLVNGELIGTFGNLIHRIVSFTKERFPNGISAEPDGTTLSNIEEIFIKTGNAIEDGRFRQAFREVLSLAEFGNQFAHKQEPWKTLMSEPKQAEKDIVTLLNLINALGILINPFLPKTSEKIQHMLGSDLSESNPGVREENMWKAPKIRQTFTITEIQHLFQKITDEDIDAKQKDLTR